MPHERGQGRHGPRGFGGHGRQECCGRRAGQLEGFVVPCLLLLLEERPAHGYDLMDRLAAFGLDELDPGGVYRNLRRLEESGCVESAWDTDSAGPARRTYRISPDGRDLLQAWANKVTRTRLTLDSFLRRYADLGDQRGGEENDDRN